jgi:hypothetical protein
MLAPEFIIAAILLRLLAGLSYLMATIKGEAKPNPVTWFFWGLAPLVAFIAQLQRSSEPAVWMTLILSLGPLAVFTVALTQKHKWKIGPFDIWCGSFAALGIIMWQLSSEPLVALLFGILADIIGSIPTLRKGFIAPHTEKMLPYLLSVGSMAITILTIQNWKFMNYAFPVYILLINLALFSSIYIGTIRRMKHYRPRRA